MTIAARARVSRIELVVLLGALSTLPPLSIDVALPGLPTIARALHVSGATMAHTLSVFMFAFAAGQLVMGPLSDRFGRRPVALAGLTIFTLAGIVCTGATSGPVLLAARFVQGFGACAGTVVARAVVQDVSRDRERAASLQAYVSAVTSLAPILAPLLGAAILAVASWRWLYGILVLAGVLLVAAVLSRLPETASRTGRDLRAAYVRVLALPRSVPLATLAFCLFGAYFALISGSPFALVAQMHVPSGPYAVAFALNATALLAGTSTAGRLVHVVGAERLFAGGIALAVLAGVTNWAAGTFAPSPAAFVATFALVAFAFGIALPSTYAAALAPAGADAGLASGIVGAAQMFGGATGSAIAAALPWAPSAALGATALVGTGCAALAYLWSTRTGRAA